MANHQYCVSCNREVARFKDGVEWKIYCGHRALDVNGEVNSESPAICDDCFTPTNKRFADAKHYDKNGKWIGPKHRMIEHAKCEVILAESKLNEKRKELTKLLEGKS